MSRKITTAQLIAVVFVVLYVISPVDLIPDLAGPLSSIDDALVAFIMAWGSGMLTNEHTENSD